MMIRRYITAFVLLISVSSFNRLSAQPGYKVDVKKPEPYTERVLRAEKTGDGKLKGPKKFFQNLTTHYNYYYNASTKLNEILDRAKAIHRDDYSELLPFYNYSREQTKSESVQLDSIIYKSQTGIVMHDLRNDWADEMYLLWGVSYYLWDKLDSATMMFQFINHAFADKEADGYYIPVGTAREGLNAMSIATKEKGGLFSKTTSRNNAFIWQTRTLTDLGLYAEAAGMINTLKNDPFFPARLDNALEEVQAYWFYKQQIWDSAAVHLSVAAETAGSRLERARWEYLAAQMYELAGKTESAKQLYTQSIPHTTDPVMEVYARLNLVRLNRGSENYVEQNIAELLRMAKRDKYEDYRDIIYYMAAQMEMERGNLDAAQQLLIKGSKSNNGNVAFRNKAFLQIADLSYKQKKYRDAASYYDSIQVQMMNEEEQARINERKPFLSKIAFNEQVVERQDSLQHLASLSEKERNDFVQKLVKRLRKEQGLKDEPVTFGRAGTNQPVNDFFPQQQSKGEWYFYNTTAKTQGQQQFKQIWGTRPNSDNWRRSTNVSQQMFAQQGQADGGMANAPDAQAGTQGSRELSVESLTANIPLDDAAMQKSNDSIKLALNTLGIVFLNEVEDYQSTIDAFEALRKRFPDFEKMDELLFNLYYAYLRAGNAAMAAQIKALLQKQYASSSFATLIDKAKTAGGSSSQSPQATRDYERVYNLFLEGAFDQAKAEKRIADSVYQTNHWQPQLLYIESVYYISQREDSTAKNLLSVLVNQEGKSAMGEKAANLLSVLSRRAEIEKELSEYQIQNQPQAVTQTVVQAPVQQPVQAPPPVAQPVTPPTVQIVPEQKPADTVVKSVVVETPVVKDTQAGAVAPPQPVKTADTVVTAITQAPPPVTQAPKDTVVAKPVVTPPVAATKPTVPEQPKVAPDADPSKFYFDPNAQHFAVVVLDKVDPIFVNEARNAFFRFTREKFPNQQLSAEINDVNAQTRLVLVGNFNNAAAAIDFLKEAKRLAASEIVPWLKADKYTFSIISARNLNLLKQQADWSNYKKFADEVLQGKF